MEGIELTIQQETGIIRCARLRLCRVEQVRLLFRLIEGAIEQHTLSQVLISLDKLSLLRSEAIRQAFVRALSARSPELHAPLIWAGGSTGDAAFIRSVSAVAKSSLQRYETEREAMLALRLSPSKSPEAV